MKEFMASRFLSGDEFEYERPSVEQRCSTWISDKRAFHENSIASNLRSCLFSFTALREGKNRHCGHEEW
jgi:hypothetical protein